MTHPRSAPAPSPPLAEVSPSEGYLQPPSPGSPPRQSSTLRFASLSLLQGLGKPNRTTTFSPSPLGEALGSATSANQRTKSVERAPADTMTVPAVQPPRLRD